jgi:hypothetical protein
VGSEDCRPRLFLVGSIEPPQDHIQGPASSSTGERSPANKLEGRLRADNRIERAVDDKVIGIYDKGATSKADSYILIGATRLRAKETSDSNHNPRSSTTDSRSAAHRTYPELYI